MARLVDINLSKDSSASGHITEAEQEKGAKVTFTNEKGEIETREQRKARRAQVMARGMASDRLHVDLPPNLHGEWVPFKDGTEIHRKQALGFRIDTQYATERALHSNEGSVSGGSVVGDCVFMVCDMEDKEILDEIRRERYVAAHVPKKGKQKEERDFLNQADSETAPVAESSTHVARKHEIRDALEAAQRQSTS